MNLAQKRRRRRIGRRAKLFDRAVTHAGARIEHAGEQVIVGKKPFRFFDLTPRRFIEHMKHCRRRRRRRKDRHCVAAFRFDLPLVCDAAREWFRRYHSSERIVQLQVEAYARMLD